MPTIQVHLIPVSGPIGRRGAPHTYGLRVVLNFLGPGTTAATNSGVPAELRFFEIALNNDAVSTPSLIARLAGSIRLDGTTPIFDAGLRNYLIYHDHVSTNSFIRDEPVHDPAHHRYLPPLFSTDFFLNLELDDTTFQGTGHTSWENTRLFLPWRSQNEERNAIKTSRHCFAEIEFNQTTGALRLPRLQRHTEVGCNYKNRKTSPAKNRRQ